MKRFRKRIFEIIQPYCGDSILGRAFDATITVLILVSVVVAFAVTFDLPPTASRALVFAEHVVSIVFTVEYLLRLWTADMLYPDKRGASACARFVFSPMAIIDLVAILPFWLPILLPCSMLPLRTLRLVRLLRIFKLNRYCDAMSVIGGVLREKRYELAGSLTFVFVLMLISSLLMYAVEHEAQPEVFRNAFSGLWWAVATLTTVGYGDIYPVTIPGRILAAMIAFSGIAFLAIPTGIVTAGLTEHLGKYRANASEERIRKIMNDEHDQLLREMGEIVGQFAKRQETTKG